MSKQNFSKEDLVNKGYTEGEDGVWHPKPKTPMLDRALEVVRPNEHLTFIPMPKFNDPPKPTKPSLKAKTTRHQTGKMNGAEKKYSEHLTNLVRSSEILEWAFEPEKFRLADSTYYTPDFRVIKMDGAVEFHEVKAFWKNRGKAGWMEDARVKIKVAAEQHPYPFIAVCLNKDQWQYEFF